MPFVGPHVAEPGLFKPDHLQPYNGGVTAAAQRPGTATTYYVDPVNGADANNGLSPDASASTNKPWKTIGKALGASGMGNGDTVYLAPGVYREALTSLGMATPSCPTYIVGDPANAQGFKTSGGVLVAAGEVRWTTYLTNDTTAPSGNPCVRPNTNYLDFSNINFVTDGNGTCIDITGASKNMAFTNCSFVGRVSLAPGTADVMGWRFNRCRFVTTGNRQALTINPARTAVDYDVGITVLNCQFLGGGQGNFIDLAGSGSGAGLPGGVIFRG